jgi:hypothetical protein
MQGYRFCCIRIRHNRHARPQDDLDELAGSSYAVTAIGFLRALSKWQLSQCFAMTLAPVNYYHQ